MLELFHMTATPTWARIEALMHERGWETPSELAERARVDVHALYKLRNGSSQRPSAKTAEKLASALGCSVTWIMTGKVDALDLTDQDRQLIEAFHRLAPDQREAWLQLLDARSAPKANGQPG